MKNLSFWAQSLDNKSPDIIFSDGKELHDDASRQKLVSEIYAVPKNKAETLSLKSSVSIRYSDQKFVIEVIPTEKDQVNRLSPVVVYGQFVDPFDEKEWVGDEQWINNVCDEISIFVSDRIKRTLDDVTLESIRNVLKETLKKKREDLQKQNLLFLITNFLTRLLTWLKTKAVRLFKNS
jgi:hypothetical protein